MSPSPRRSASAAAGALAAAVGALAWALPVQAQQIHQVQQIHQAEQIHQAQQIHQADRDRDRDRDRELQFRLPQPLPPVDLTSCPCTRYTPWDGLASRDQRAARRLGYDSHTWNYSDFASNPTEFRSYSSLTGRERRAAADLGYSEPTWDCCLAHYSDWGWEELGTYRPAVQDALRTLAYTRYSWDQNEEEEYDPDAIPLERELTAAQTWCTDAAMAGREDLCLTQEQTGALGGALCYTASAYRAEPLEGAGGSLGDYGAPDHCRGEDG